MNLNRLKIDFNHTWQQWKVRVWPRKSKSPLNTSEDHVLIEELRKACEDWRIASKRIDYAVEHDQIDYAIYMLEAAEKRYDMLLRQAKKAKLNLMDPQTGKVWGVQHE